MTHDEWGYFPVTNGQGSVCDLRDAPEPPRSRLWGLKSPSRAACTAYDPPAPKATTRRVGFCPPRRK